jgi:hypothetical protein
MKFTIRRINQMDIHTRVFLTDERDYYFVILKPVLRLIADEADYQKLPKQIEIGNCDLFSLLPVDSRRRIMLFKPKWFKELTKS